MQVLYYMCYAPRATCDMAYAKCDCICTLYPTRNVARHATYCVYNSRSVMCVVMYGVIFFCYSSRDSSCWDCSFCCVMSGVID